MRKFASTLIPISLGLLASFGSASQILAQDVPIDRTVLPIPQPTYPPVTELDARNVKHRSSRLKRPTALRMSLLC